MNAEYEIYSCKRIPAHFREIKRDPMVIAYQSIQISGVILAAGTCSGMGSPRQLLPYNRTTLLGQVIGNLCKPDLDDRVVVLGQRARKTQEQIDFKRDEFNL